VNRVTHVIGSRGEGGIPPGRTVAFDRWLPFSAGVAGRQGGWAVEALTTRRSRGTNFHRLNAAVRPPQRVNRALRASLACVLFNPRRHVHVEPAQNEERVRSRGQDAGKS